MALHNIYSKEDLIERLNNETFRRKTISFYRYHRLDNPEEFRNYIYREWEKLNCLGRIYVACEGINAQMSIPENNYENFLQSLRNHKIFLNIPIKEAVEDDGKSFFKLTIKVRPKIVADGLDDATFDVTNVGKHLSALEFHQLLDDENTIVVDMRNGYESEIGHFQGAICPPVDTFREEITLVEEMLQDKKEKKILLYCTGGVRCEKASAFLKHKGYRDVNQLYGGIIEYAREIKKHGIESKFIGKNFVFDNRLGERISDTIISKCHQCGAPCDMHTNCDNQDCHLLFIQCQKCAAKFNKCCSTTCRDYLNLSEIQKKLQRNSFRQKNRKRHCNYTLGG